MNPKYACLSRSLSTFSQLLSPCNVCHRLALHSKRSSCPIGRPGWFPGNSQWRGSVPRTSEAPTAAPGSRFPPPWTAHRRDNLRERRHAAYQGLCFGARKLNIWWPYKMCKWVQWLSLIYPHWHLVVNLLNDFWIINDTEESPFTKINELSFISGVCEGVSLSIFSINVPRSWKEWSHNDEPPHTRVTLSLCVCGCAN